MQYHDYLALEKILNSQKPASLEAGQPAHDEMLFIITHQAYELWFKQILHELDSVLKIFTTEKVDEKDMGQIVLRLERIGEIQKLLLEQIRVIETMTPLDFLEFRKHLYPASGFQSFQFRLLEIKLGLRSEQRLTYNQASYDSQLLPEQANQVKEAEASPSLFDGVEKWLERTPFLSMEAFDFWRTYRSAVEQMFQTEKSKLQENQFLSQEEKQKATTQMEQAEQSFQVLFEPEAFTQARQKGQWRLSHRALQAALLIQLYRDQPILHLPFRLITALIDIDELMTTWRYRHALMAKRMLGARVGTGGSSGFRYLLEASEKHKVFNDFFQLTTFFIPRSSLPPLPPEAEMQLGFF